MNKAKYSDKLIKELVESSTSFRQVIIKLGLKEAGGTYNNIQKKIRRLNIDTSHFTGQVWNKGYVDIELLEKQLKKNTSLKTSDLKNRLFKVGLKKEICEICKLETWLNGKIPLELHHVNGVKTDNRLKNLQILCPNCHALTPNYRGKNHKKTV